MRRSLVVALSVGLLIGMVAPPTVATVERVPVSSGNYFFSELLDPGEFREVGGMDILRGLVVRATPPDADDLIKGTLTVTLNWQVDTLTGVGTGHGSSRIDSSVYPDSGWEGRFTTAYLEDSGFSRITARGFGEFEGMTLRGIDHLLEFGHLFEGEVLMPPSAG